MKSDPTFWIIARASGITAYLALACGTVAGPVLKSRLLGRRVKPASVTDLHRFLASLSLTAVAVHGAALVYDRSVAIDWLGLVVPGRIPYRPVWTAVGVVAAELTVLIYASFSVRKLIRVRNWRRLHWLTYAVFAAVTLHGLLAGSDSAQPWMRDLYLGAIGLVAAATAYRGAVRGVSARAASAPRPTPAPAPEPARQQVFAESSVFLS